MPGKSNVDQFLNCEWVCSDFVTKMQLFRDFHAPVLRDLWLGEPSPER